MKTYRGWIKSLYHRILLLLLQQTTKRMFSIPSDRSNKQTNKQTSMVSLKRRKGIQFTHRSFYSLHHSIPFVILYIVSQASNYQSSYISNQVSMYQTIHVLILNQSINQSINRRVFCVSSLYKKRVGEDELPCSFSPGNAEQDGGKKLKTKPHENTCCDRWGGAWHCPV